ncbi:unnamed protein product [Thlaspi arvense]|uniref:CID domain-containing protein n=1 Tax=Thlaspi arvense TaxID=13288 RepID=A0AAU9SZK7_THLAR|nr:unnamed protein product [Thlaspi arvense]
MSTNSKRQGNEFVQEFWNVLPKAVKDIVSQGDDRGKGVVSRLVKIWEERRVFGSRSKNLRDVMLGEDVPLPLEVSKKRPRGSKSSKRDSKSSRTKLSSSGCVAEKIASAYHLVVAENSNEEAEMNKCKSAVKRIRRMEKDVDETCSSAKDSPKRKSLAKELEEEEYLLRQCMEKLKSVQGSRSSLVNQLKDALREQESELDNLKAQIQVAQEQTEEAQNMQKRLNDEDYASKPTTTTETSDNNANSGQASKMTPASIAAMLTASTSSHMIMQSVLSSFAAEATKTSGLSKSESAVPVSDTSAFVPSYSNSQNQTLTTQGQYHVIPNPAAAPQPQFLKPPVMNNPYGFGNIPLMPPGLPPPPPPPQHMIGNQQPQIPQTNTAQQQSQQGPTFQPPGIMYYGAPHHS